MVPCNAHWKPVFCKVPVRSFQLRDQNEIFEIVRIVCALTVWPLMVPCNAHWKPVFCKVPVRSFQLRDQNEIF